MNKENHTDKEKVGHEELTSSPGNTADTAGIVGIVGIEGRADMSNSAGAPEETPSKAEDKTERAPFNKDVNNASVQATEKQNADERAKDTGEGSEEGGSYPEKVLDASDSRGLIELTQDDNIVAWSIEGLLDEKGKVLPRRKINAMPPELRVSDSNGNEASFFLTKELSAQLRHSMNVVYSAHYGVEVKKYDEDFSAWSWRRNIPLIVISCLFVFSVLIQLIF